MELSASPTESPQQQTIYTVSSAARRLNVTYQKLIYAIAKKWLKPFQQEPEILIYESDLFRYANEQEIEIPE